MIHANFPVIISINYFVVGKSVYPQEYMDDWEKLNETSLPEKKIFNSHLDMKDTDADYTNAKRVCKEFEIKNLGEYHDFMFKVIQLLSDIFENFQNK